MWLYLYCKQVKMCVFRQKTQHIETRIPFIYVDRFIDKDTKETLKEYLIDNNFKFIELI